MVCGAQAYHEIETRLVTETVFSQYMYKTLPTSNHLWAFKKQFCTQMALSGARAGSCLAHPCCAGVLTRACTTHAHTPLYHQPSCSFWT